MNFKKTYSLQNLGRTVIKEDIVYKIFNIEYKMLWSYFILQFAICLLSITHIIFAGGKKTFYVFSYY